MKTNRINLFAILICLMAFLLAACAAPAPVPTEAPIQPPTAIPAGRISGRIEFQAPPTPATALYVVNILDGQWLVYEIGGNAGPALFDLDVPAGMYQLYARQSDGGPMAAAYLNPDDTLGALNVGPGEVVSDILLKFAAPQTPCQKTALPASPDGRFPGLDATCTQ